jgi:hypothetical protein
MGVSGLEKLAASVVVSAALVWPVLARAQDDAPDPNATQVHAFISQGYIKTTSNNYLSTSQHGAFDFTEVGVNLTKNLTDDLRVGAQLFTRDLGPSGTYIPQFDWLYADYRVFDWLGFRAGRTKIPFGLYNEGSEADQARVPVLLPQSVYPIDHQDYLLAQTGGEVYGNVRFGKGGAIDYRAYGGTLQVDTPNSGNPAITVANLSVPYVVGGRLMYAPPVDGLQLGMSFQQLRLDWNYDVAASIAGPLEAVGYLPPKFSGVLPVQFRVTLYVWSAEYQTGNLLLAAEYSRWVGEFQSNAPKLLPPITVNERYYAMASYRMSPWFTPGVYYSVYFPDVHHESGRQAYQRDLAVTARYDINAHLLVKLEGHVMTGTAALDSTLNAGTDLSKLPGSWGVLLVKATAYF